MFQTEEIWKYDTGEFKFDGKDTHRSTSTKQ